MTRKEVEAAFEVVFAIADAIREAGQIPAGELYAMLMGFGCTEPTFNNLVEVLTTGPEAVVRRDGNLLVWVGGEGGLEP